ncbi:MAG: CsgG/HfaB family protein [Spirochaetota bacterium]
MKIIKIASFLFIIVLLSCSTKKSNVQKSKIQSEKIEKSEEVIQQKDRIAVLDFKTVNIPNEKSRIISELIRTDLINSNKYTVIERSQVDMIFKEHGFSQTGVTDDSSAARIGKLLTARKILIGSVMKLGEQTVVTCRVVDVEKGIAESSSKITADSEEALVQEISNLIASLTGESPSEGSKTIIPKIHLKVSKNIYKVGEDIVVTYKNFPGTRYDYISIAKENEAARNHYTYQYTSRQREGTITFYGGVNAAGKYEVRSHTNYDKGDLQPTGILKFTVK